MSLELPLGGSELILDDVSDDDEALYTCSVASTMGMTQRSAWITVLPAPCEYHSLTNQDSCPIRRTAARPIPEGMTIYCLLIKRTDGS